jgi:hypothetical protein
VGGRCTSVGVGWGGWKRGNTPDLGTNSSIQLNGLCCWNGLVLEVATA